MARKRTTAKGGLELLEEAVHLLRRAPLHLLALYYLGALPFVLGFLYFWADMSRSAFATDRIAQGTFVTTALFFWMKIWQSIFASELRGRLAGGNAPGWNLARVTRLALTQMIVQPSGFFVLPIAAVMTLPFGWACAFYQSMTVLGDGMSAEIRPLLKKAAGQARLWTGQNHVLLLVLTLFGFFVWLNFITAIVMIPSLIKTFLGIETVFTRSGLRAISNTTFFAATLGLVYLAVDPLIKTAYVLRCFYGESIHSGEDLKVELKGRRLATQAAILIFICSIALPNSFAAEAGKSVPPETPSSVGASQLNRSIEEVLTRREFTWRLPREESETPPEKKGWFVTFIEGIQKTLVEWVKTCRDWIRNIIEWFDKHFGKKISRDSGDSGSGDSWLVGLQLMTFVLLILVASAVAIIFYRLWKRRKSSEVVVAQPAATMPDLRDENVVASQLPEDGWLKLARELIEKGDLRLALRALYLASLAHLAEREFVSIAKFKSNRDYERELSRRARALPELQSAFAQNVGTFDSVWYGLHEVTQEHLQSFQTNVERIRAC